MVGEHPTPGAFLESLKVGESYGGQLAHVEHFPARDPRYGALKVRLHRRLTEWIERQGLELWLHQTGAINRLLHPKHLNVVITTPTASGKSLCYDIPVLDAMLRDDASTALYLFPRKALGHDQYRELVNLAGELGLPPNLVGVYDGDATPDQKRRIRDNARVVLTTPHGLHYYLPNWRLWRRIFQNLKYIVIDEAHVYRGVFGSNVAFVLRRLQRILAHLGSDPRYVLTSATIANPAELASKLTGKQFEVVDKDGAGSSERFFAVWIPPEQQDTGERVSSHQESRKLFAAHLLAGFQTLMFTTSRKMAELQARWARKDLAERSSELAGAVSSYRAGLAPVDRRRIEKGLKEGTLRGVVSTNALELGVDIGDLDATILSGFPGSISSFWQQAGRSGRKGAPALSTFVPFVDALDMFYAQNPETLFGAPHEEAVISLENPYIVRNHIKCAARERPISPPVDEAYFGSQLVDACEDLVGDGVMAKRGGRYTWHGPPSFPAGEVGVEAISRDSFEVFERVGERYRRMMSEERGRVFSELHEGAVYLYLSETYVVESLDLDERRVVLRKTEAEKYTQVLRHTEIEVLDEEASKVDGHLNASFGLVNVTHEYSEYVEKSIHTNEVVGRHPLALPRHEFTTKALWFTLDRELAGELPRRKFDTAGVVHAIEHGTIAMIPLHVLCDRRDIGGVSMAEDPDLELPVVYIYDGFPGGIGLVERAYNSLRNLLETTLANINGCSCTKENGCPACIMSPKCGNLNEPLDKAGAIFALQQLLKKD
ncbi:MAG: DEAD/DEAH box helicase [Promethearchaeota archaeon]